MATYLLIGTLLGLSAGFAPGPMVALVISETLQHNIKAGIKVAFSPLLTDLPIIVLTLLVLGKLSNFHSILGVISLIGGMVLIYMGYQCFRAKNLQVKLGEKNSNSLTKGTMVNLLNPHPYLFWLSVGGPTVTKAMAHGMMPAASFILGFYFFLTGSKIALAIMVGKSRAFLNGKWQIYSRRSLAIFLWFFALVLFREGLTLLKII